MWHIVRLNGALALVADGDPIPEGAEVIGQTVDPDALAPQAVPVPASVSRFQARSALALTERDGINLFEAIDGFMLTLPATDLRRRAWEDAQAFERSSLTLSEMSLAFGLSDADLDDLFRLADTIRA